MTDAAKIEIVKKIYAAINQNDIPAVLKFFDEQTVRIEPESFPSAGVYRGLSEVGKNKNSMKITSQSPKQSKLRFPYLSLPNPHQA